MATEDWIQESLARLESMEEERNRHEAALETANDPATLRTHTQAIERLDAKIRALYAELEAAAEQGEVNDAAGDDHETDFSGDEAPASQIETRLFRREDVAAQAVVKATEVATTPTASPFASPPTASPFASPSAGLSAPAASPFASSAAPAVSPFGAAPLSSPFGGTPEPVANFGGSTVPPFGASADSGFSAPFGASSDSSFATSRSSFSGAGSSFDDDESRRSSSPPWGIIMAIVVVLVGLTGYLALRGGDDESAPPPPAGPTTVIKAPEIPPDTQGPKGIKSGNVDSVKDSQLRESRSSDGGGSTPSGDRSKKKDQKTKIVTTDDPLHGIN